MGEVIEFCFWPRCHYGSADPQPHWVLDPFAKEELWPRLYCPACGKPRWLAITEEEFKAAFSLDVSPRGVYLEHEPRSVDRFRAQASEVDIYLIDGALNPVAWLWDIRVRGEMSIRDQFGLGRPDACRFSALRPCERTVCAVCGNLSWQTAQLTPVLTRPGDIVWVCRHGHFQGQCLDPYTGMVWEMTGDKMLEVLEWVPELVVPEMKYRWWGLPDWRGSGCEL